MTKQKYVENQIPKEDHDQLAKLADKLGRDVDDLAAEAVLEDLERAKREVEKSE